MSKQSSGERRVGVVGGAAFLELACQEALDGVARVLRIEVPSRDEAAGVEAVLVASSFLLDHGVRWLERCRAWNGDLPLILLSSREHADVGDALLRCTFDDVVPIAKIPDGLRESVLRLLGRGDPGWSFQAPPLLLPPHVVENRRRCYRARPPIGAATAIAMLAGFEIDLDVHDLSIAARGAAGAMRLGCDPMVAPPFELLAPGQLLPLRLHLADAGPGVDVQAGLISGTVRRGTGNVCFAARYTAHDPEHKKRIRSFWVRCQRPGTDSTSA